MSAAPEPTLPPVLPAAELAATPESSSEGVHVERRALLWIPLAVAGGRFLAAAPIRAEESATPPGRDVSFAPLTHAELGSRWQALARELLRGTVEHDESYAAQLAGLVARLPFAELPGLESPRRSAGFAAGPTWFLEPCAMIEFRMDPGAVLRLHNHPPQVVLTLCAEGEVAYRHLEIEGQAPPCTEIGGTFRARETRGGFLSAGRTTSLTRVRDGMHAFAAGPDGARIVDFTVSTTPDVETFSYVELAPETLDPERRVWEARWVGKS